MQHKYLLRPIGDTKSLEVHKITYVVGIISIYKHRTASVCSSLHLMPLFGSTAALATGPAEHFTIQPDVGIRHDDNRATLEGLGRC